MIENKFTSITVRKDPTFLRLQRLGNLGDTYDTVVSRLLDLGERELLAKALEEAIPNYQK